MQINEDLIEIEAFFGHREPDPFAVRTPPVSVPKKNNAPNGKLISAGKSGSEDFLFQHGVKIIIPVVPVRQNCAWWR